MRFTAAGKTDVGLVRKVNEDNMLLDEGHGFFLVADGLGGHSSGEVASEIVVKTSAAFIAQSSSEEQTWPGVLPFDRMTSRNHNRARMALELADAAIIDDCCSHPKRSDMGSTAIACLVSDHTAVIANVGDSRAYLIREGELRQLSVDHSWVWEQVSEGRMTKAEARKHPYRNVITQALGGNGDLRVALTELDIHPGDQILLCSDGLYGMVTDDQILAIMFRAESVTEAVDILVKTAIQNGGEDNVTVIIISAE